MARAQPRPATARPQPRGFWRPQPHPEFPGGTARRSPRARARGGHGPVVLKHERTHHERSSRRPHENAAHSSAAFAGVRGCHMIESQSTQVRTMLLYAQDNRGMGHINRTLTIARHLLAAHPDFIAYIATKSPITSLWALPARCDYIKLPRRLSLAAHTEEEKEAATVRFRKIRSRILREAALALSPEFVLVDHEPLGSAGEFRDGLSALKAQCPGTKFVFGLRDIMDDAARIRAQWRELGVYDALENLYDGIAVYGSPRLFDVAEAYAVPPSVQSKLAYCGYIVRDLPPVDAGALRQQHGLPQNGPLLVATVGSGYDGYPVLDATGRALARLQATFPDLGAILVTGPFMRPELQAALAARASGCCRVVAAADTFQLMAAADAIVSMGGYNS